MKRFNYIATGKGATSRRCGATLAIDNRVRGPLAALAATVAFTVTIAAVQLSRLHIAQDAYVFSATRLVVSEHNVAAMRILQTHVDVQTRLVLHLAEMRSASLTSIAHVAWVGNHLPHDTWLHSLRYENGSYSLEGTAARPAAVGNAIIALHADGRSGKPQLISLRDDQNDGNARIHYTLQLEQQP